MKSVTVIETARKAAQSLAQTAYANRTTAPETSNAIWNQAMGLMQCAHVGAAMVKAVEGAK